MLEGKLEVGDVRPPLLLPKHLHGVAEYANVLVAGLQQALTQALCASSTQGRIGKLPAAGFKATIDLPQDRYAKILQFGHSIGVALLVDTFFIAPH